jgi:hypothetical protein
LLNLPVIVLSTANDEAKLRWFSRMLRTIIFVSLPNLSNSKEVYKTIKLIAEGNLDLPKQENFLITVEAKSKLDESNPS